MSGSVIETRQSIAPYVGLRPFEETESFLFFGRERDINRLLDHIYTSQILIVFAPSGVGKSSLLRAGVIPKLREEENAQVFYFDTWTSGSLDQVRQALASPAENEKPAKLLDVLRDYHTRTEHHPILIFDQFEELARYRQELDQIWDALAPICNVRNSPARLVLTLREDHLGMLDGLMDRVPGLMESRFRVAPLTRERVESAIREPLSHVDPPYTIENALVEQVSEDLERRYRISDAEVRIEPGYLQLVCRRLWTLERDSGDNERCLRLDTYKKEGGAQSIIEGHIRRIIDETLTESDREVFYAMVRYLVAPSAVKIALSAEDLAGLLRLDDFTKHGMELLQRRKFRGLPGAKGSLDTPGMRARIKAILDKLCDTNVLVLRRKTSGKRVDFELFHDLLGPILLEWRQRMTDRVRIVAEERLASNDRAIAKGLGVLSVAGAIFFAVAVHTYERPPGAWVYYLCIATYLVCAAVAFLCENRSFRHLRAVVIAVSCVAIIGLPSAGIWQLNRWKTRAQELVPQLFNQSPVEFHRLVEDKLSSYRIWVTGGLVSTVQQRPGAEISETERVSLGQRRADAAIALFALGSPHQALDVFMVDDDPEALTQFVHRCKARGLQPTQLFEALQSANDNLARYGLLLSLGEFKIDDIPAEQRLSWTEKLSDWYRQHPSSAVHGASGWLLRQWGEDERVNKVDQTPIPYDSTRQWFVMKVADDFFTMIVFPPATFQMGSPSEEANRRADETLHSVQLTKTFAICDRELTWDQFQTFSGNRGQGEPGHPAVSMTWNNAVEYCNWLTKKIDAAALGEVRLPTEAEWEYACRAGTRTRFGFGSDESLLGHYAWFEQNSRREAQQVSQLRPNLRGLFDMHGNVWEWCRDWGEWDDRVNADAYVEGVVDPLSTTGESRLLRGGGWYLSSWYCRSAVRYAFLPGYHNDLIGFRVCVLVSAARTQQ